MDEKKSTHQVSPGERLGREKELDMVFRVRVSPPGHTNQGKHIRNVRQMGREFAAVILASTPSCADQSAALRCVREAVAWAEEAIHLEGLI